MEAEFPLSGHLSGATQVTEQLAEALAEIRRLQAEAAAARAARDMALAELVILEEVVTRVRAACDLAVWAAEVAGAHGEEVTVDVGDIRRAFAVSGPD